MPSEKILSPKQVELLAPVGTWDMLEAVIAAGADAVYLGGKRFNMRMHRTDYNFDDTALAKVIEYAHKHNVLVYITVNNLLGSQEIEPMASYLEYLQEIQPDALIIQDLAIIQLIQEKQLSLPLHASVMMNTHNEHAIRALQAQGVQRVVTNRELTLCQLALLQLKTGVELEYFIHGDMCVAHSGQCYHSGVLFGQSSNRGRCLKPCRWPYRIIDTETKAELATGSGPYKLALKDMCMFHHLPELIQAGVCSFKIEGRMRTADFASRIVRAYRRGIDRYLADPTGYRFSSEDWGELYETRVRDFSTCYALGNPGPSVIGYDGQREPRFFSQAVKESAITFPPQTMALTPKAGRKPTLAVKVADLASVKAACENGADTVHVGGEAYWPATPWTLEAIREALHIASAGNTEVIIDTPRITLERECAELEQFFPALEAIRPHGVQVGNLGSLRLAKTLSSLPLYTDYGLNVFNHIAVRWLKKHGVSQTTVSIEATCEQITNMAELCELPLTVIVHGSLDAMILEHDVVGAANKARPGEGMFHAACKKSYALLDTAEEYHPIKIDQFGRNHILFAKDLCLLPYLNILANSGIRRFRIEAHHYSADQVAAITALYRHELNMIVDQKSEYVFDKNLIDKARAVSPRDLGTGVFRYKLSR